MTDHRALIEETRREHTQYAGGDWCRCGFPLPCLAARLAEALARSTPICGAIPSQDGAHSEWDTGPAACPVHAAELEIRAETAERERDTAREPIKDTYACQRCSRRDGLDAVLHDDDWAKVSAAAGGLNLLCLWCIDELAEQVGVQRKAVYLAFAGRYLYSDSSGVAAVVEQRNSELRQELETAQRRITRLSEVCAERYDALIRMGCDLAALAVGRGDGGEVTLAD